MSTRKPKPAAAQPAPENAPEQATAAVTETVGLAEAPPAVTAPTAQPAPENAPEQAEPTHYLVAATKARGRWRAGRFWTREPARVHRDELDADAWAALDADPAITVTAEA